MTISTTEAPGAAQSPRALPVERQRKIDGLSAIIREHANTGLMPRGCHAAPNPCAMCLYRAEQQVRAVIESALRQGYVLRKIHGSAEDTAETLLETAGTEII